MAHDCKTTDECLELPLQLRRRSGGVGLVPITGNDRTDRFGQSGQPPADYITVDEFADLARLSRRQIDRLRKKRPSGFPREYELGSGMSKYRSCPRFKRTEVDRWLDSRALW